VETGRDQTNAELRVIRWSARVLGGVIGGGFLLIFIASGWGRPNGLSQLEPSAALGLSLMGVYIVAMFLALKWERAGALLGAAALGAFFVTLFLGKPGGFSREGVLNPFLLAFWLPVVLYLLCWGIEKQEQERERTEAVVKTAG